jgi:RNA polymerase sigma factor (sigma-70 family)
MLSNLEHQSDENLIVQYQQTNNRVAVGELFKRHSLMCYAVCVKYLKNEDDAQDATMNIFEQLFTDLKKHQVQHFKSWLHSVCRNHCLMLLRKKNPEVFFAEEENDHFFMQMRQFMHQEDNAQEKEKKLLVLEDAIKELKNNQRLCIELFYLKLKSYEEIAAITGLSMNEVKSNLQNGKRNLKIALNEKGIVMALYLFLWIQQVA